MPYPSPFNVPNHFAGFATGMTSTADPGIGSPYRPFYVSDMVDPNNASRGGGFSARAKPEIGANTYVLGWLDGSGRFHPYSYLTGLFTYEGFKLDLLNQRVGTANPNRGAETWTLPDPRTERFSLGRGIQAGFWETITVYRENNQSWAPSARPRLEEGFIGQGVPWQVYSFQWGHTMVNSQTDPVHTNYYRDPDGVVRPGDGFYGTPATGDGMMTFITPGSGSSVPGDTGNDSRSKHGRHPIILDRPFRSVAELGYVFRDQPFKTLDFFTDRSADAALLDVFSINGSTMTVQANGIRTAAAGRINPGAAPARAIEAMLKGGGKKEFVPAYNFGSSLTPNDATAIASQFVTSNSPDKIDSYPALVAALTQAVQTAPTGAAGVPAADKANKAYLEGSIRALAGSANLRTWNLTIDVVAQTGRVASSAQNLGDFIVEGERRMWLHVAIDRYTGEVVARQLEPVYE